MDINIGEKFSVYGFVNFSVSSEMPDEYQLADVVWALPRLPVEISDHWQAWLGSLRIDEIKRVNFALATKAPSLTPQLRDQENELLTGSLDHLLYGLLLQGVPYYENGFSLSGANVGGDIQIREFSELADYVPSYDLPALEVGIAEIKRATSLAEQLGRIAQGGRDWARLRRGLKALLSGSKEKEGGDRLHQFARALEALIKPDIGNTRRQFGHRAQTFALGGAKTRDTLLQIFDIRSQVEHLHSPLDALDGSESDRIALANRRTKQADILSRFAFGRVLESEQLLNVFRTDASIDAFWQMQDDERIRVWGQRLDLTNIP